ncbi:ROK family protein [Roseibium album]|uniref:ROK family protein n=1 Tax=Roseibium album TaxID=311410 RepID=UPI002493C541|nr:ROK family protein [Roseibium album]
MRIAAEVDTPPFLCIDAGYTLTRFAVFRDGELSSPHKVPTINTRRLYGLDSNRRMSSWLSWLAKNAAKVLSEEPSVNRACLCFPGVVDEDGSIFRSNSIWGNADADLATEKISETLGMPTTVLNDLVAAAVRYGEDPTLLNQRTIAVISISSGIGAKIYDRMSRRVVLEPHGRNGELGLAVVDYSPNALTNDNGRLRGILGNYASGTGYARLFTQMAMIDPEAYANSAVAKQLACHNRNLESIDRVTLNEYATSAINSGDAFALSVLHASIVYLARALHIVILFDSPDLIVLTGGFVTSVGEIYRTMLVDELCLNLRLLYSNSDVDQMVRLGAGDDQDNLLGAARWVSSQSEV